MEAQKRKNIVLTIILVILIAAISALFYWIFERDAKKQQNEDSVITPVVVGVPNYSYSVDNDFCGSFNVQLQSATGNVLKPDSIVGFVCNDKFVDNNGSSKPIIFRTRLDSSDAIYYNVDSEYAVVDTLNKFDKVTVTVTVAYNNEEYKQDIEFKVTDTPGYSVTFYYNTEIGALGNSPTSELLIGSGNKIDLAVEDANRNGADIDLATTEVAKALLTNKTYDFDGWYLLDSNGSTTSRKFNVNDYFDISDMYVQNETDGIKNIAVIARYKTKLLLDDDMGEVGYLSLKDNTSSIVSNVNDATAIYYNEQFPITRDQLPTKTVKNSWNFDGWYSSFAGTGEDYLDSEGRFVMRNPHLYAKWQSDIKLDCVFQPSSLSSDNVGYDKNDESNTTLVISNVVYHSSIVLPTTDTIEYAHGGQFDGWYTISNGVEREVKNTEAYQYSSNQTIYAKVKFPLQLNYRLLSNNDLTYYIVYGSNESNRSGLGVLETKLPEELSKKYEWTFVNWNTKDNGSGVAIVDSWEINPYENSLSLYDNWRTTLTIHRELDELGQATRDYEAITVMYGAQPNLPVELASDGWTFEGCYKVLADENSKISSISPYISLDGVNDLYVKWSRDITLKITDVTTDQDREQTVNVTYDVVPSELVAVQPEYNKGGQLAGWYSSAYGDGVFVPLDSVFTLTKCDTLYNKIIFAVSMDPLNGLDNSEVNYSGQGTYTVTYGKSLRESGIISFVAPSSFNWDFEYWYLTIMGVECPVTENLDVALTGQNVIGSVTTDTIDSSIKVLAKWSCEVTAVNMVDPENRLTNYTFTAYNNVPVNISQSSWGDWSFGGWYTSMDQAGNFSGELGDSYWGIGRTIIYGKWNCTSYLVYNSSHSDGDTVTFTYGINNINLPYRGDNKTNFGTRTGYTYFIIWSTDFSETYNTYTSSGKAVSETTTRFPQDMLFLYAVWQPQEYTIELYNGNEKFGDTSVKTGEYIGNVGCPSSTSLRKFSGYYNGNTQYVDADGKGSRPWDLYDSSTVKLYAQFNYESVDITLDKQGGDGGTSKIGTSENSPLYSTVGIPTKTGYIFKGYFTETGGNGDQYYNENGNLLNSSNWNGKFFTLYAYWVKDSYTLTISQNHVTITVKSGSTTYSSGNKVPYDTALTISFSANSGYNTPRVYWNNTEISSGSTKNMPAEEVKITSSATEDQSCVAAGTLVTLANGVTKAIEHVTINDIVLTFDHATGTYVYSKVLYNVLYGSNEVAIANLFFSDNSTIQFVNAGHGIFDVTLNQYVLIDANNVAEYLGHSFLSTTLINGDFSTKVVELINYGISYEAIDRYDIVTENAINCVLNNLITCSDALVGVCNTFEFADDFTYDLVQMAKDIETYGLFTYEEWSEFLSYDDFVAVNGAYFKIAVGKGLITEDEIFELIEFLFLSRT